MCVHICVHNRHLLKTRTNRSKIAVYIAHGSIPFKQWLPVCIHNNDVAAPKCIILGREKCFSRFPNNLQRKSVESEIPLGPRKLRYKVADKCPSGGHIS